MLIDTKRSYEKCANLINGWRQANKNDLANAYVEACKNNNQEIIDAYFSALICRYWYLIDKNYAKSCKSATREDCYDWLVHALQYALSKHKWLDPSCSVYGDPNGPDKIIHQVTMSTRQMYYQSSNTYKRRSNYGNTSLEEFIEDKGDTVPAPEQNNYSDLSTLDISRIVSREFNRKNYIAAFIVDGIINYDTFEHIVGEDKQPHLVFSDKKLAKHLRNLDESFCDTFSETFNIDKMEVRNAVDDCMNLSRNRLGTAIKRGIKLLSRNKAILEIRDSYVR